MYIEHVAMYVKDIDAAKDFFTKYLGGRAGGLYHNPKTGFCSYFISFEAGARLELMTRPDTIDAEKPLTRTGYAHIAFGTGSRGNVDSLTEELRSSGYKVISGPRTTGDGYYESCIVDIEGNQIELTV